MKFFLKWIALAVLTVFAVLLCAMIIFNFPHNFLHSVSVGTGVSLFFVGSGFFTFYYAWNYAQKKFNKIFIASIMGRLLLISVLIILIMNFVEINIMFFLISLFIFYFIFQIIEVIGFNKIMNKGIKAS